MARTLMSKRLKRGEMISQRYKVVKTLGEGGSGTVYRCKDSKKGDAEVAIKVLEDASEMPRFRREAKLLNRTDSEHVVNLLARGIHDQRFPYLVMEYMNGGSVRDLLDKRGKLPVDEACWILIQSIKGLKAARSVHRDLKPENLLISKGTKGRGYTLVVGEVGEGLQVKVADFGLAKSRDEDSLSLTHSGQVMGTPVYMSPEQCRSTKRVSVKTDIYALGVMLYEMTCGKPPFDASNVYDIMAMHCNDEPNLNRVPKEVRNICEKCLRKEPGKRYATLAALERDLRVVAGLREGSVERDEHSRGPWLWLVVILVVLGGLGAAAWYWRARVPFIDDLLPK